jgi:hypothetical protein
VKTCFFRFPNSHFTCPFKVGGKSLRIFRFNAPVTRIES